METTGLLHAMGDRHARVCAAIAALRDENLGTKAPGVDGRTRKDIVEHSRRRGRGRHRRPRPGTRAAPRLGLAP